MSSIPLTPEVLITLMGMGYELDIELTQLNGYQFDIKGVIEVEVIRNSGN